MNVGSVRKTCVDGVRWCANHPAPWTIQYLGLSSALDSISRPYEINPPSPRVAAIAAAARKRG